MTNSSVDDTFCYSNYKCTKKLLIYTCISNCFRNLIVIFLLRFLDRKFIIIMESICANLQTLADLSSGIRITGNICYENSQYFLELPSKNALY